MERLIKSFASRVFSGQELLSIELRITRPQLAPTLVIGLLSMERKASANSVCFRLDSSGTKPIALKNSKALIELNNTIKH